MNIKTKSNLLVIVLSIIIFQFNIYGVPPHPDIINEPGVLEYYNNLFFRKDKRKFSSAQIQKLYNIAPQTGTRKVIVLKVDFSNKIGDNSNVSNLFTGSQNSLKDYYDKASYEKINLDISIYPSPTSWYRAEKTYEYYGGSHNEENVEELVREIVQLADTDIVYSNYDFTGNGYVDHLIVLHSGNDEAITSNYDDIWSHQYNMFINTSEPVNIKSYAIVSINSPIGVLVHEFGHELGMVDLYSAGLFGDGYTVVGRWCIMDAGSWVNPPPFPNAWHKILVGWITPETIYDSYINYSLPDIATNDITIKIPIPEAANPATEYFLIENRQRISYDAGLPGHGLLIWHIDDSIGNLNDNSVNTYNDNPRVKLITANGSTPRITNGSSGDPWKSNLSGFGPYSNPQAIARNGTVVSDTIINNISNSNNNMTFNIYALIEQANFITDNKKILAYPNPYIFNHISQSNLEEGIFFYKQGNNSGFTMDNSFFSGNEKIKIYTINGQKILDTYLNLLPHNGIKNYWNIKDKKGNTVSSGTYIIYINGDFGNYSTKVSVIR